MQEGFLDVAAGVVVKQFVVDGYSNDGDFFAVLCPCDDVELAVAVAHGTITGVELLMEQGLPAALLEYYLREIEGVWVDFVVHSNKKGRFVDAVIYEPIEPHVKEKCLYINSGDSVKAFDGANQAIGTLFMRFDTYSDAEQAVSHSEGWLQIEVA